MHVCVGSIMVSSCFLAPVTASGQAFKNEIHPSSFQRDGNAAHCFSRETRPLVLSFFTRAALSSSFTNTPIPQCAHILC